MADPKMPAKLGRYEVIRELGKGAMGVVYEGKDPNIGRRVAIKTARREVVEASGMADEMMERFLREAQAAGALNHPNIITIYDAAEEDGMAYIAMEYLEGGDLGDIIDTRKRLGMEEIVEIGANICEALHVAHLHGVVHRDIKPANILMPTGKPLKVADFGIAHVSDSNLTQDGALIGTPHYMSPEQFMGQKLDGRSDLFSVGNILYELTTGEKPFGGEALSTVMHKVIKIDPVPPTELNFAIPDALAQVIMKAMSKRPANRYKTGNEMAAALRESLKEQPNPAILDPGANAALSSTMAAPAAPPLVQATLLSQPESEDFKATIAGARPASQESTIADAGPGATVPGGAPSPGATVAGPPPADASAGDELSATVPGAMPVDVMPEAGTPQRGTGPNKSLMIGGGVAAAILVVIGAVVVLGGGKEAPKAESPVAPAEPVATSVADPNESPASETNGYADVVFEIYRTKAFEDYKAYSQGKVTLDDLNGKYDDIAGQVVVEILNGQDEVIQKVEDWESGGLIEIPAASASESLRYRVHIPLPENPNDPIVRLGNFDPPVKPGDTGHVAIILPPVEGAAGTAGS